MTPFKKHTDAVCHVDDVGDADDVARYDVEGVIHVDDHVTTHPEDVIVIM